MKNLTASAIALVLLTGALDAQSGASHATSFGNSDVGADLSFNALYYTGTNSNLGNIPYYGAFTRFLADGKIVRKDVELIDVGGEAITTPGGTGVVTLPLFGSISINVPPDTHAKAWLEIGGFTLYSQSNPTSVSMAFPITHTFAGIKKSYGVGPVSVTVNARVYGTVTPSLGMSINPSTQVGTCTGGVTAKATVTASGGISASGYGVSLVTDITLVELGAALTAQNGSSGIRALLDLTAEALRLKLKVKVSGFGSSWSNTIVDRSVGSWHHSVKF